FIPDPAGSATSYPPTIVGGGEPLGTHLTGPLPSVQVDSTGETASSPAPGREVIDDRTEEKLRELLELYRLVGRATNDTIWDWCLVTDRVVYSEAAQTMFGYAADEIGVGDNWWTDRVHPDDIDRVNDVVKAVLSAGDE